MRLRRRCALLTQDLSLASCSSARESGLLYLLPYLPGLTSLDLRDWERVTDASMEAVAANLSHLVALDVRHCPRITPACLPHLASLPRLRTFDYASSGLEPHLGMSNQQQLWQHLTTSPPRKGPWWMTQPHPMHPAEVSEPPIR